jgi:DNA-binding PadR family transcriptional regulator
MGARVDIQGSDPNAVAMRSAVNWAVLGLVIQRQGYGYDLYQRFDRTYGGALALSCEAQVYKALTALKNRGLIEELPASETSEDDRRQPKPRYRATPAAVPAYQDWLIFQVTQDRQRSALFSLQ